MRIGHVVTLLSPDGAYGGPMRVAQNQLAELQARGHDVRLYTTHRGFSVAPVETGGIPVTALPARTVMPGMGFAGTGSWRLLRALTKDLAHLDVLHVHLARDFVTLPAARLALASGVPLVLQTHGMIDPSERVLSRPLDAGLTRPVLSRASAVLALNATEEDHLRVVSGGSAEIVRLVNGVPLPPDVGQPLDEVLYLGRLHERKRPAVFVEAALRIAGRHPGVRFTVAGPDEGEGDRLRHMVESHGRPSNISLGAAVPPEKVLGRMSRARVFVLPSVREPFPMAVLEAASLGLAIVMCEDNGLASIFREAGAALVSNPDPDAVASAIEVLLNDPSAARQLGCRARRLVATHFTIGSVVDKLELIYGAAS